MIVFYAFKALQSMLGLTERITDDSFVIIGGVLDPDAHYICLLALLMKVLHLSPAISPFYPLRCSCLVSGASSVLWSDSLHTRHPPGMPRSPGSHSAETTDHEERGVQSNQSNVSHASCKETWGCVIYGAAALTD